MLAIACAATSGHGQRADLEFRPLIIDPAFEISAGPVVLIDEAHFNFHTAEGRYKPFAELLRRDGYIVRPAATEFTELSLAGARILVISNALNEDDFEEWMLPNPSAFTRSEIEVVRTWVQSGGSLLLIADHMPFPGVASELAAHFGLLFTNGYARHRGGVCEGDNCGRMIFTRTDGSLRSHPITNGRSVAERIDSVTTFTGQAFRTHPKTPIDPLLVMGDNGVVLLPKVAAQFNDYDTATRRSGLVSGCRSAPRHRPGRRIRRSSDVFSTGVRCGALPNGHERSLRRRELPVSAKSHALVVGAVRLEATAQTYSVPFASMPPFTAQNCSKWKCSGANFPGPIPLE